MKTRSKYALSVLVAVTTVVTTVAVAPSSGRAEESLKEKTLAQIDSNLDGLNEQIGGIEEQTGEVNGEIDELNGRYSKLNKENQELLREILSYMKDDYVVTASSTTLDSLISSQSLSDLASAEQYRNNATDVVREKFDTYIKQLSEIEDLLSKAKEKRQGLLELKGQLEQRRSTVQAQEEARQAAAAASEAQLREIKEENEQATAASIAQGPSSAPSTAPSSGGGGGMVRGNNPYTPGQCTWYVYNQTGRGQMGNAGQWGGGGGFGIGKILIMPPGAGGAGGVGHVGVIVGGSPSSGIVIRDMNWAGPFVVTTHTVPRSSAYRYL
ncbi:MAG TPA: hypothetical protein VIF43_03325 [Patescibacteria group bacterium]|jgi:surface antigen